MTGNNIQTAQLYLSEVPLAIMPKSSKKKRISLKLPHVGACASASAAPQIPSSASTSASYLETSGAILASAILSSESSAPPFAAEKSYAGIQSAGGFDRHADGSLDHEPGYFYM
jgi:hypothetical protein